MGTYGVRLAAPRTMVQTGRITTATFQLGMEATVFGVLAKDGSQTALANTVSWQGSLIFDRGWLNPPVALAPAHPNGDADKR